MNLADFLAYPAFLAMAAAAASHLYYLWYNRATLRPSHRVLFIGVIAACCMAVIGYALILAGVVAEPPINATFLRLAITLLGGVLVVYPSYLLDIQQQYGLTQDMREAVTEAERWRLELGKCKAERDKAVQLANMSARVVRGQEEKMLEQTGKINTLERRIRELERERGRK